jgi:hypothetical protein
MEIKYQKEGDFLIPILELLDEMSRNPDIGKYGIMRLNYLKEHRKGLYESLKIKNELYKHLTEVELEAQSKVENLIKEYMILENVDENLKEKDQMKWVGLMNNFRNLAEEIVKKELIYI